MNQSTNRHPYVGKASITTADVFFFFLCLLIFAYCNIEFGIMHEYLWWFILKTNKGSEEYKSLQHLTFVCNVLERLAALGKKLDIIHRQQKLSIFVVWFYDYISMFLCNTIYIISTRQCTPDCKMLHEACISLVRLQMNITRKESFIKTREKRETR